MKIEGYIALARTVAGGANESAVRKIKPEDKSKKMLSKSKKPFEKTMPVFGKASKGSTAESVPKLYVAKSPNKRYTGEYCGQWFENGEALVTAADAFKLELKGCEITEAGAHNDH